MKRCVRAQQAVLVLISAFGFAGSVTAGGGAPKEAGIWYDDTGKGAVRIEQCENKLCGKIYWLKETVNAEGKPLIDRHNPTESQRTRPICGLHRRRTGPVRDGSPRARARTPLDDTPHPGEAAGDYAGRYRRRCPATPGASRPPPQSGDRCARTETPASPQ